MSDRFTPEPSVKQEENGMYMVVAQYTGKCVAVTDNEADALLIAQAPAMYRLLNEAFHELDNGLLQIEIDKVLCQAVGE